MVRVALSVITLLLLAGCFADVPAVRPQAPPEGSTWTYETSRGEQYTLEYEGLEDLAGTRVHSFQQDHGRGDGPFALHLRLSDGARSTQQLDEVVDPDFIPFMHWGATDHRPYTHARVTEQHFVTSYVEDADGRRFVNQTEYWGATDPSPDDRADAMEIRLWYHHQDLRPRAMAIMFGTYDGSTYRWTNTYEEHLVDTE